MATKSAKRRRTTRVAARKHRYLEDRVHDLELYVAENYEWARGVLRWSKWVNRQLTKPALSEEVPPVPKWPIPKPPPGFTRGGG